MMTDQLCLLSWVVLAITQITTKAWEGDFLSLPRHKTTLGLETRCEGVLATVASSVPHWVVNMSVGAVYNDYIEAYLTFLGRYSADFVEQQHFTFFPNKQCTTHALSTGNDKLCVKAPQKKARSSLLTKHRPLISTTRGDDLINVVRMMQTVCKVVIMMYHATKLLLFFN